MAKEFIAQIEEWVTKVEKIQNAVVSTATTELLAGIDIVSGKTRGGNPQKGQIPRDLGALAGSLQSSLYGSTSITQIGKESHVLVAGSMEAGDVAEFVWGGTDAPYARRIHYGFSGEDSLGRKYNQPGLFWVDEAANKWQGYIDDATRRAKAEITG
jgi:hypothetical protein